MGFGGAVRGDAVDGFLKNERLMRVRSSWRATTLAHGVPDVRAFHVVVQDSLRSSFLARVEAKGFCFVLAGDELAERLGRDLKGQRIVGECSEMFGSLLASYRLCIERRAPSYEFFRFDFGDARPGTFERLILPFASNSRREISHIGGTIAFV